VLEPHQAAHLYGRERARRGGDRGHGIEDLLDALCAGDGAREQDRHHHGHHYGDQHGQRGGGR